LGQTGAIVSTALAGFADAHAASAAAASLAAGDQLGSLAAELAVLLAVSTNASTKIFLAFTSGPRGFSVRVVIGQILALAAMWTAFAVRLAMR
jgi:uncharacterized membrane protein (DUF4010 family)